MAAVPAACRGSVHQLRTESLRGLSLLISPFDTDFVELSVFAVFFGLDYIATVLPTVVLVGDRTDRMNVEAVFVWVFFRTRSVRSGLLPRRRRARL